MKTNQLILAAAALLALAACTKETPNTSVPENEANEIGFKAVSQRATKANDAIITGATYGTDNTFKVWGWQSEKGDFTDTALADNAASNFMSGIVISWNKGYDNARAEAWRNASQYYYWPFTGAIGFLAVHPSSVAPASQVWDATNKKAKASFADYTISAGNKTTDLMIGYAAGSRRSDALPLTFNHALSQIEVQVKTNDDYTHDVKFDVNSVTINNIDMSGDLAYTYAANPTFTWTDNTDHTASWVYYNNPLEDITKTAQVYGAANVMIPQPAYIHVDQVGELGDANYVAPVEGTTITIGYSMQQKPLESNAKITGTITVVAPWTKVKEGATAYDPAVSFPGWEPGKKYVYTLNFNLYEINFDPTVTNWVTVEVSPINIP